MLRGVSLITTSAIAGQVLLLLVSPLLTRIYEPEEFGALAVYGSVTGMLTVIAGGRWELAVPVASEDDEATDVVALGAGTLVVVTALTSLGLMIWGPVLTDVTNTPALEPLLWCIPLGILGAASYRLLTYWLLREQIYKEIAYTSIVRDGTRAGSQLGLGWAGFGTSGLVVGQVVGDVSGCWRIFRTFLDEALSDYDPSVQRLRRVAARYRRFPIFSMPASLLNTGARQAPALVLAGLIGPAWAGFYSLTDRVLRVPMRAVGNAVAKTFYSEFSSLIRNGRLEDARMLFLKTSGVLLGLSAIPAIVLIVAGEQLFSFVFGSEWAMSGRIASILGLVMAFQLTVSPVSQTLNILERQKAQFAIDGVRFAGIVGGMVVAWRVWERPLIVIAIYMVVMVLVYVVLWCISLRILRTTADGTHGRDASTEEL